MLGSHRDALLLVHVIWCTRDRRPILATADDAWLHDIITKTTAALGARVIAVGNAADHVHVVASHPAQLALTDLVQRIKGVSSHSWNLHPTRPSLRWQRGYWARSIDQATLTGLVPYVVHQRQHHASRQACERWEQNAANAFDRPEARPPGGLTNPSVPPALAGGKRLAEHC